MVLRLGCTVETEIEQKYQFLCKYLSYHFVIVEYSALENFENIDAVDMYRYK